MDLEFKKKLAEYDISIEEYSSLSDEERKKVDDKINSQLKQPAPNTLENTNEAMESKGGFAEKIGYAFMLIPILGIIIILIKFFIF